jgi:acyl-coenzyme A thioesterase PaaI-like protein
MYTDARRCQGTVRFAEDEPWSVQPMKSSPRSDAPARVRDAPVGRVRLPPQCLRTQPSRVLPADLLSSGDSRPKLAHQLDRWMYRGGRPSRVASVLNGIWRGAAAVGLAPRRLSTSRASPMRDAARPKPGGARMASTPGTAFDRVTNVHADGDGRYSATLDSVWDGPFGRPNGGVIAAILLRASQAELAQPELPPRVLNVHYLRPATRDPAQLAVHLLRVGGRNATVQVSLHQHGHLTATALITFSASRPHALTITEPAPSAPHPTRSRSSHRTRSTRPRRPCANCSSAPASACRSSPAPATLSPAAGSACATTTRTSSTTPPRLVALTDLWWPAVLTTTRHLVGTPTLELTIHLRTTTPVRGPILGRFATGTIHEGSPRRNRPTLVHRVATCSPKAANSRCSSSLHHQGTGSRRPDQTGHPSTTLRGAVTSATRPTLCDPAGGARRGRARRHPRRRVVPQAEPRAPHSWP